MKTQGGSSRMDSVLKGLLIVFISLLAFSFGVYFGKQMSDSDYQLKALESDFSGHSKTVQADKHGDKDETSPEDAINEEEVAALSEKFVDSEKEDITDVVVEDEGHGDAHGEKHADKHGAESRKVASADEHKSAHADDHAAPTAAHGNAHAAPAKTKAEASHGDDDHAPAAHAVATTKAGKPDLSAAHKAAVRVANNANPHEAPAAQPARAEQRAPSSLPKTVGATRDVEFTVQVASYPTAEAAKEHAEDLVKKGFPAFPVEATVSGRTWYRVSVGSFKTKKEATSYRGQILKQADLRSAIVQRIQR